MKISKELIFKLNRFHNEVCEYYGITENAKKIFSIYLSDIKEYIRIHYVDFSKLKVLTEEEFLNIQTTISEDLFISRMGSAVMKINTSNYRHFSSLFGVQMCLIVDFPNLLTALSFNDINATLKEMRDELPF